MQEAKIPPSAACLDGKKKSLFSVLLACGNTSLLEERYCVWYKHLGNIKLNLKIKNKLINKISVTSHMREEESHEITQVPEFTGY